MGHLEAVLQVLVFLIYLTIHHTFNALRQLCWHFSGVAQAPVDRPVRLLKILYRQKRDPEEIARSVDFIAVHEQFTTLDTLEDAHWTIYTLDKANAYFVRLERPVTEYHIKKAPFIDLSLCPEARQMAVISLQDFLVLAENLKRMRKRQPRTVFFTNTARCGSTLFGQMLQHEGLTTVYGEHPALITLSVGLLNNYWPADVFKRLLQAVISVLQSPVPAESICIFKTSSCEARLVPYLQRLCPELRHIFMFRKGGLSSVERLVLRDPSTPITTFLFHHCRPLCAALSAWAISEEHRAEDRVETAKEYAAIIYASPYANYLKNKEAYCLPIVWYHELIAQPHETLTPVFEEIGIPLEKIPEAVQCLARDSQDGTYISREAMQTVKATVTTDSERRRLNEFADLIRVPRDIFETQS